MVARGRALLRVVVIALAALPVPPVYATDWGPREDVGVAAVDTRSGKVLWEAWRPEEVPAGTSKEQKAAAVYLLGLGKENPGPLPRVTPLPEVPVKDLNIKEPWPPGWNVPGAHASQGKTLTYYRHARGVVALDRRTKKEVWRLETARHPYPSLVLEVGENQALIQIGSDIPATLRAALDGNPNALMRGLEPHTLKQRAAAFVLLHHYGDDYLRPEVRKLADQLRKDKDDRAALAAKAIEKRLADWPKARDRARLLPGSVAALLMTDEGNPLKDFAWPEARRVLTWALLQELIYGSPHDGYGRQGANYAYDGWKERPVPLPDATKAKLADHCRKVVAEGPDAEKPFAASVLVSSAVGWARLTDAERKTLFLSDHPSVWRWAALALAKNDRRKELMEWSGERPVNDDLDVLWVLAHDPPQRLPNAELKFWLAVARRKPGSVAYTLWLLGRPAPTEFREPILAYLKREMEKPTVQNAGTQPAYDLMAALRVLDAWKNPADTPLLLAYLKHPAHSDVLRLSGDQRTEIRVYGMRGHIRNMLEARGAKAPPDVVYEEIIGPAKE